MDSLVDPEIREKQEDWLAELESVELPEYVSKGASTFASVTDKHGLAAIWIFDSIYARSIDFPQSDFELLCYRFARSRFLRYFYNIAVAVQILLPFFAPSGCSYASKLSTVRQFIIIDVLCLIIYLLDIGVSLLINRGAKPIMKKPWTAFRLLCCLLLFLDCIGYSSYAFSGIRLVRSLFPFFLIARRTNLQKMFQGIFVSGVRSLSVIVALISVVIMWSFVGFLVFRNISTEAGSTRFDDIPSSMFATLHCFTSRPFCLLALKPYFAVAQLSAVFFVTLTLAADVLCIGLIVAIGTSEYKLFAAQMVTRRLTSRLLGLRIVFDALAVDGQLHVDTWVSVCDQLRYGYHRSPEEAKLIFSLEAKGDSSSVDFEGYLRLCSLLSSGVVVVAPKNPVNAEQDSKTVGKGSSVLFVSEHSEEFLGELISPVTNNAGERDNHLDQWKMYWENYRNTCYVVCTAYVTFEIPSFTNSHMQEPTPTIVTLRSIASSIIHFLLVIYLCYVSAGNAAVGWYRFGQALEFFFWVDMILKASAFGIKGYWRSIFNRFEVLVNIASFISMCVMGTYSNDKGSALVATLIIQSFRFLGLFFMVNDFEVFEMIYPILIRAGFIYFSVVYFFAIFAHTFFCGSLSTSAAAGGDDDSQNWIQYSSELNFSTYLQALYTMFEMSLLANWSIVMDAAARVAGNGSFFFFYIYRLLVTLFVLPILLGFVMQAFLAARRKKAALTQERQKKLLEEREQASLAQSESKLGKDIPPEVAELRAAGFEIPATEQSVVSPMTASPTTLDIEANSKMDPDNVDEDRKSNLERLSQSIMSDIKFGAMKRKAQKRYSVSTAPRRTSTSRISLWNADAVRKTRPISGASAASAASAASGSVRFSESLQSTHTISSITPTYSVDTMNSDLDRETLLQTVASLRENLAVATHELELMRRKVSGDSASTGHISE